MDYDVNLSQFCPVEVQQIIRQADVRQSSAGLVFDNIADVGTAGFNCLLSAIGYVGQSLKPTSEQSRSAGLVNVGPGPNRRPQDHAPRRADTLALCCASSITATTGTPPERLHRTGTPGD